MNIQAMKIDRIKPNPYQTRATDDAEHIARLADDLKANGLLQVPLGRPIFRNGSKVIDSSATVELAFGHSRLAAWQIAFPDQPMPVDLRDLTDRQMSDFAASENAQRKNLTAIETARAIQRRVKEFNLTQMEAAKPFGYTSQGAVSNLLRLLELPAEVQQLVNERKLAERNARALLTVERLDKTQTLKIARAASAPDVPNQEDFIDGEIRDLIWSKGKNLRDAVWQMNWAPTPMETNGGDPLTACQGCPARFAREDDDFCGNPKCYDAKFKIALPQHIADVARKLDIVVAEPREKPTLLFDGTERDYDRREQIQRALKAKRPELRLLAFQPPQKGRDNGSYDRERLFGSEHIALATVDLAATNEWLKASADTRKEIVKEARAEERQAETPAQQRKRIEREKREELERRAERAAFNKNKFDTLWLADHAAQVIAEQVVIRGGILRVVEDQWDTVYPVYNVWTTFEEIGERLVSEYEALSSEEDREPLRRQRLVFQMIAHNLTSAEYGRKAEQVYDFAAACHTIDELATETLAVKLPRDWHKPPIHRTAINCWHCGQFAPGEKLTKRDVDVFGWIDQSDAGGDSLSLGVFCSAAHQQAYVREQTKTASKGKRK